MNYLKKLFITDLINKLGGQDNIEVFGRQVDISEIFPVDGPLYNEMFAHWKIYKSLSFGSKLDEIFGRGENGHRFSELSSIYNIGEVLPFIGAGFSIPSGMIGWHDLLDDLSDKIVGPIKSRRAKDLVHNYNYEEAADKIFHYLGKLTFDERLENRYSVLDYGNILGTVRIIPSMFNNMAITTNFDNILELILSEEYPDLEILKILGKDLIDFNNFENQSSFTLIKLHGDYKIPHSRILLKDEYDSAYSSRKFKEKIRSIAEKNTILFLGCSLIKDRYLDVIKSLKSRIDYNRRNYTIMKSSIKSGDRGYHNWIDTQEKRLNKTNIFPIWVDNHEDIEVVLYGLLRFYAQEVELGGQ